MSSNTITKNKQDDIKPIIPTKNEMRILEALLESKIPLSTRGIEKKVLGSENVKGRKRADVYDVIKNKLYGQKFGRKIFLFDWNKLLSTIDEKLPVRKKIDMQSIVKNLNRIGLKLNENDSLVEFTKNEDGSLITITNGSADERLIKIQRISKDYAVLTTGRRQLSTPYFKIEKFGDEENVFYEDIIGNPEEISCLNISLNEKSAKKVQRLKSMNPDLFSQINKARIVPDKCLLSPEFDDDHLRFAVSEINRNTKNWVYYINTRGLILYILGKVAEQKNGENGRARNVHISNILENISQNYKKEFPFLLHYKEIKELYDKIATDEGMTYYQYFQVKIIKKIALELQYNINTISKEELDYYITKRYSDELTERFVGRPIRLRSLFPTLEVIIPPIIRRYLVHNHDCMRKYLTNELQRIEYNIKQHTFD